MICIAFQFSLFILAKPNITTRPKQPGPATKGDMIQLQCLAHGTPKPEIIWVKKNSGRAVIGSNFILESALPEDSGIWTCRASNLMGTDTADVEIIVASEWFYILVKTIFHPELFFLCVKVELGVGPLTHLLVEIYIVVLLFFFFCAYSEDERRACLY